MQTFLQPMILWKIGVQFFEAGELEKAKSFFEEFVEENEKNSEAFYYLVTDK